MKRYSKSMLSSMSAAEFACDVLRYELECHRRKASVTQKLEDTIDQLELQSAAKISYTTLSEIFRNWESTHKHRHLSAYVTFTATSMGVRDLPYRSRTFRITSDNNGYRNRTGDRSIYGTCLDGTASHIPLHLCMAAEQGGRLGWRVESCQLVEHKEAGSCG